ncbi:MAG: hypothetical protein JW852_01575, partial [Spirochaetales bacterium]|nr:hypothetical protein [Spirochaetales bacterium]
MLLRVIILLAICVLATGYVYARGGAEDPFAEVDLLFSEKRYTEGLEKLNAILKDNPELFDQVQQRNAIYLEVQKAISRLEEGIIEDIKNGNPEGVFEKIGAIRDLDPQPNEYRGKVLADYLYEAAIIVNKKQVDEIMDAALALARAGEYWKAIALYTTGLDVGREIFETSEYGVLAVNGVIAYRNDLEKEIAKVAGTEETFSASVAGLETALTGESIPVLQNAVDELYLSLMTLAGFRNGIKAIERELEDARTSLRLQREDNRDIAYLRYIHEYLLGREDVEREGVLPLIDELWKGTNSVAERGVTAYF